MPTDSYLDRIILEIRTRRGFEADNREDAEMLVGSLFDRDDRPQDELADALMILGYAYRQEIRYDDATRMYIHAQGRYVENPMDESPGRARALWFLAEAHYRHCNFDIAASVFERAVKMYCATIGLTSPEARACLEDYLEFARGLKRDRRLTREVEDIIEFADWVADLDQAMDENGEVALSC